MTGPEARADEPASVRLSFVVAPPGDTPDDAVIHLAGSAPSLGPWRPDALPLRRGDDGLWRVEVDLPRGGRLEFKFTLGAWERVEKDAAGGEIANRAADLEHDQTLRLTIERFADGRPATRKSTVTGRLIVHEAFASARLGAPRTLRVWLPGDYDARPDRRHPVLYLHDGQNVFDDATSAFGEWRADETAARLIASGAIEPIILVGIDHATTRLDDYTPTRWEARGVGGRADAHADFVMTEVKPFIDRTYRTDPARVGVGGSSLGGLASLHIARRHPGAVQRVLAMSPSLWWDDAALLRALEDEPGWSENARLWLDIGTAEGDGRADHVDHARRLAESLRRHGRRDGADFRLVVEEGTAHNEAAWARRLDDALRFLYPSAAADTR